MPLRIRRRVSGERRIRAHLERITGLLERAESSGFAGEVPGDTGDRTIDGLCEAINALLRGARRLAERDAAERQLMESEIAVRDATAEAFAWQAKEAELLHHAAGIAAESRSIEDALRQGLEMICTTMGWCAGRAYLPAADGTDGFTHAVVWPRESDGTPSTLDRSDMTGQPDSGTDLAMRVLWTAEPVWTDRSDPKEEARFDGRADGDAAAWRFGFPIKSGGQVVAVTVFRMREAPRQRQDVDRLMRSVASQLSRVFERIQAAELLRQHHENLERMVEARTSELLNAQQQILQNDKLASVGRLAAGVAHEINTPIQFITDNLRALTDEVAALAAVVDGYRRLRDEAKSGGLLAGAVEAVESSEQTHDLDYVLDDAPKAIAQALDGAQRVAHIVRAMKDFSHVERGEIQAADVNELLSSTLTVARNEYKYVADVKTEFAELPTVECYGAELVQVFLNLIVNAAHAVADTGRRGVITVRTRVSGEHVEIAVDDTGVGIAPEIRNRVFEPFFTTKEVGRGTGQGLSIAHQIVVGRHGGTITFDSEVGRGTTFVIRLPVSAAQTPHTVQEACA